MHTVLKIFVLRETLMKKSLVADVYVCFHYRGFIYKPQCRKELCQRGNKNEILPSHKF